MNKGVKLSNKTAILFVILYILINYLLIVIYHGDTIYLTHIGDAFGAVAPILTGICLIRLFFKSKQKLRYFWLLSSFAAFSFLIGNIFDIISRKFPNDYSIISHIFWLMSILFCLFALIFANSLTKNLSRIEIVQFVFDIVIVMVVVTSICWNFVLKPIIASSYEDGLFVTIFNLVYPIGDLALLFAVLSLYYSSKNVFPQKALLLAIWGFSLLFFANMNFLYVTVHGFDQIGSWYDPLWTVALLLLGLATFYYTEKTEPVNLEGNLGHIKGKIRDLFSFKLMLPYLSVLVIFGFMIIYDSLEINGLVVGSILSTFLIIIRQVFTLIQNNNLLQQSKVLNKQLEMKVIQRTKELHNKNLELEQTIKKVEFIAYHDSLTFLPNRRYFEENIVKTIEVLKGTQNELAILFIDLDRFKFINDTLGHSIGDLLLRKVAEILQKNVGEENIVSRQGGDEFMILLRNTSKQKTEKIAKSIVSDLENTIKINGKEIYITSSVGISMYPRHGEVVDTLIKRADMAMYIAKEKGKNRYQFFDKNMDNHITTKVKLENGLRRAIKQNELQIYYQPKYDLRSNSVTGVEALLRWKHPEEGFVSPSVFIPLAEETGLIGKIGEWVLREACLQLKKWNKEGLMSFGISVNVSTVQFLQKGFVKKVHAILHETQIDPQFLELEITESTMMDTNAAIPILKQLKEIGIEISVDDFGSGYSSLRHLSKLPINILKIDQLFVEAIGKNNRDTAILSTIITLAHNLNLTVIAEGVENEDQFNILRNIGCDLIQGYFISKALPIDVFTLEMIEKKKVEI